MRSWPRTALRAAKDWKLDMRVSRRDHTEIRKFCRAVRPPRRRLSLCVGLVLLAFAATECSSNGPPPAKLAAGCMLNSDCDAPFVCTFGRCHVQCNATADCESPQRCVIAQSVNVCQLPLETSCTYTSQCPPLLVCAVDGQCRNQCQADRDCLAGQLCSSSRTCAETSELDKSRNLLDAQTPDASASAGGEAGASGARGDAGSATDGKSIGGDGGRASVGGSANAAGTAASGGTVTGGGANAAGGNVNAGGTGGTSGAAGNGEAGDGSGAGACPGIAVRCGTTCTDTTSDPDNCGACGVACGGECYAGGCIETLASGQALPPPAGSGTSPVALAVHAGNAYWINWSAAGNGVIETVPTSGGTPAPVVSGLGNPAVLAVDGVSAYWTESGTPGQPYMNENAAVMKVALSGGSPQTLWTCGSACGQYQPNAMAIDSANVYWGDDTGTIQKVPLAGGAPTPLTPAGYHVDAMVVVGSHLYVAEGATGQVRSISISGGTPTILSPGTTYADISWGVAADASNAYWTTGTNSGRLMTASVFGGTAPVSLSTASLGNAQGIVINANSAYIIDLGVKIWKVPLTGGAPLVVVGEGDPRNIAIDASNLYWTDNKGGRVMKVSLH